MTKWTLPALVLLAALAIVGCSPHHMTDQQRLDHLSDKIKVNYQVTDNHGADHGIDCAALGADWAACSQVVVTLHNTGSEVKSKDWAIYFHSIRQILRVDNEQFKITHVTGDLHKLEPTNQFVSFPANQALTIPLVVEYWQLFKTDVMPRWYVTAGDAKPKMIANTNTENLYEFMVPLTGDRWKRTRDDHNVLMTAESRYTKNQGGDTLPVAALRGQIIPTPRELKVQQQDVDLSKGVRLDLSVLSQPAVQTLHQRFRQVGIYNLNTGFPINTRIRSLDFTGEMAVPGAYSLNITPNGADVIGYDDSGVYYGLQSILSLIPAQGKAHIATLKARDAPRFQYRGIFLDVGRHFHSKDVVLRLLDQMAAYKLNKFHFHLSDDEGWRIEIPGLPELTEIGSQRCHDLSETTCLLPQLGSGPNNDNMGSGYFSRADYIDIVNYAKARFIEVIPEIDLPAHARAAVVSMEARYHRLMAEGKALQANEFRLLDPDDHSNTTSVQFYDRHSYLNPCLASSKRFVDKVIGEIVTLHKEAGAPLTTWHFGGDEAKNIRLGTGYQDKNNATFEAGKGLIDLTREDKPWAYSPVCQAMVAKGVVKDVDHLSSYFAIEVSKMVNAYGIEKMQAWQDGLKDVRNASDFATRRVGVNFWDTLYREGADSANDWANKGFDVIISNPDYMYLDMPYEVNPDERGYYWATRFNDERKIFAFAPDNLPQNAETSVDRDGDDFIGKSDKPWPGAVGLSAQSWGETVRTDEQMEYMMYPRLLSVAERAWHRASWEQDYQAGREYKGGETQQVETRALERDWQRFANLLGQRELPKLDKAGVAYRLPIPGARIIEGKLYANIALPGVAIQYSVDGGQRWLHYSVKTRPMVNGEVMVRAISSDNRHVSRADVVK